MGEMEDRRSVIGGRAGGRAKEMEMRGRAADLQDGLVDGALAADRQQGAFRKSGHDGGYSGSGFDLEQWNGSL